MKNKTPEQVKLMKEKELLNGRLAMMAIGGIATQAVLTGHGFPYL
jgi:Chlorophyll A-B binding protein